MYNSQQCATQGTIVEEYFLTKLQQMSIPFTDVRKEIDYRKQDVDVLINNIKIDVKSDNYYDDKPLQTIFFETMTTNHYLTDKQGNSRQGCAIRTQADYFAYFGISKDMITVTQGYMINMQKFREYVNQLGDEVNQHARYAKEGRNKGLSFSVDELINNGIATTIEDFFK